MNHILTEITPLSSRDCFYIVERHKTEFTYPIHHHKEFELNFVEGGSGVKRVVGDKVETIGDYDLVLVGGASLEHSWEQGSCKSPDIREVTIQFLPDIFSGSLLEKNQFHSINSMLSDSSHGISFPQSTIVRVYHIINELVGENDRFEQFLRFLRLLNELSQSPYQVLASSTFANADDNSESRRVQKVEQYISEHYGENIRQSEIAALVGMSPSSFSRFFKLRTGRTLSEYVIDIKTGAAARLLVDSTKNISEICFECGFNNLSNFNRIFKAKRGMTPREFRSMYKKNKVIV